MKIDAALVRKLIAGQFPGWADLPVRPVLPGGWDNRTFRLGAGLVVRLPSAEGYALQVDKEQRWLPWLAPQLPLPIPLPLALGAPAHGYPWPWSVSRWLPGESAVTGQLGDLALLAAELGQFLAALQRLDAAAGPLPGPHNSFRGGPLTTYDAQTRQALAALGGEIDAVAATEVWEAALASRWSGPPVWVHGDVSAGNLLVHGGRLNAVIDFGCTGVGDPACDTVIAWTLFAGESREAFCAALGLDRATWARGRGWALWKALITLVEYRESDPGKAGEARRVLTQVLTDHARAERGL